MGKKRLVFIQLNELNFDLVEQYAQKYDLKNFSTILRWNRSEFSSEDEYELLEPWIQWVSVAMGLEAGRHGVLRLGDIVKVDTSQLYEEIENLGYAVAALSPMNVANRLKRSSFFIPDPWTSTPVSGNWLDRKIYQSLRQAVNDNSNDKIEKKSLIYLMAGLLRFSSMKNWSAYLSLASQSRSKRWNKAIFLDYFLSDYFLSRSKNSDFNTIFINSLAHLQHHYFKNCEFSTSTTKNPKWLVAPDQDPILDGLRHMDRILGNLISQQNCEFLIATGLSQEEYISDDYYYRLKAHENFLDLFKIKFLTVLPRMTRDFEITFENNAMRDLAAEALTGIKINGHECFGMIDKRDKSLFVTLTHNQQITPSCTIENQAVKLQADEVLTFVALKNGHHSDRSWAFYTDGLSHFAPNEKEHVKGIYNIVKSFFSESARQA